MLWQLWVMSVACVCVSMCAANYYYRDTAAFMDVIVGNYSMTPSSGSSETLCAASCYKRRCKCFSYEGTDCFLGGIGLTPAKKKKKAKFNTYDRLFLATGHNIESTPEYSEDFLRGNAMDNDSTTVYLSNGNENPFWKVDLGKGFLIHVVSVYPRQAHIDLGRFRDVKVSVQKAEPNPLVNAWRVLDRYTGPLTDPGVNIYFRKRGGIVGDKVLIKRTTAGNPDKYFGLAEVRVLVEEIEP